MNWNAGSLSSSLYSAASAQWQAYRDRQAMHSESADQVWLEGFCFHVNSLHAHFQVHLSLSKACCCLHDSVRAFGMGPLQVQSRADARSRARAEADPAEDVHDVSSSTQTWRAYFESFLPSQTREEL